jgi:hypothetical protein
MLQPGGESTESAAAAFAMAAFDKALPAGGATMGGGVDGPPLGWMPLAFMRCS